MTEPPLFNDPIFGLIVLLLIWGTFIFLHVRDARRRALARRIEEHNKVYKSAPFHVTTKGERVPIEKYFKSR